MALAIIPPPPALLSPAASQFATTDTRSAPHGTSHLPADQTNHAKELQPPQPPPNRTQRLSFPPILKFPDTIRSVKPLVTYNIPLDKAHPATYDESQFYIPPGSTADPTIRV